MASGSEVSPAPARSSRRRRRRLRLARRAAAAATLLAPAGVILLTDLARRADRLVALDRTHRLGYAGTLAASLLFWSVLLAAAARRRGRVRQLLGGLFAVLFAFVVGVEGAFYRLYNIYLSVDSQLPFRSFAHAPHGALDLRSPAFWGYFLGAAALGVALLASARRLLRLGRWGRRLALGLVPLVLVGMARVPSSYRRVQASTYDVIYFDGLEELAKFLLERPTRYRPGPYLQPRRAPAIPPIATRPARPRNVLFLLEESIRHDAVCVAPDVECKAAGKHTHRAAPNRLPFPRMHAVATSTAVSQAVLFSGASPAASEDELHRVPYVFSFAHAAGYRTAYWTGQNVITWGTRFFTQDEPLTSRAYATTMDSTASTDHGMSDRTTSRWAIDHLPELGEPFFAVVHYASAHRPYYSERGFAPYRDGDDGTRVSARYRNAVNFSDAAVAELVRAVRAAPFGERTVIVYTSDHGEAFYEQGYTGHGLGLGEEELRVPGWIDAPPGTLTDDEEQSLRAARDQLVWHPDLAATLLDLVGVWDAPEVAPYRAAMLGLPLTRPERTTRPLPLTTTNFTFHYHEHGSWGMMQGTKKLWARFDDRQSGFRCYDVATDPEEKQLLPEADCGELAAEARAIFGGTPREAPRYPLR